MRRFLRALSLSSALAGSCAHLRPATPPVQRVSPSTMVLVEQELSKFGPWIAEVLDTDYSDDRPGPITLQFSRRTLPDLLARSGISIYSPSFYEDAIGTYLHPLGLVVLFSEDPATIHNALAHEVGHAIAGNTNESVFTVYLPFYSGPAADRIKAVVDRRIEQIQANGVLALFTAFRDTWLPTLAFFHGLSIQRNQLNANLAALHQLPSTARRRGLESEAHRFIEEFHGRLLSGYPTLLQDVESFGTSTDRFPSFQSDICASDLTPGSPAQRLSALLSTLRPLVASALAELQELNRRFRTELAGLSLPEKTEPPDSDRIQFTLRRLQLLADAEKVLASPPEVWARMVASLMVTYVGEDCSNFYRLTPAELDLFNQMRYLGKPMFRNAVSKYHLALMLLEKGYPPEQTQQELEFATRYEYNGVVFTWPPAPVDLIGESPVIDRIATPASK